MKPATAVLAAVATASSGALGLEKRVVGGSAVSAAAASSSYSFVTNIIVNGKDGASACTGALLAPTVVLTSASCVADPVSNIALVASRIVVGQGNLASMLGGSSGGDADLSKAAARGYVYPQSIFVHPGYSSVAHSDNIAVLILPHALANATDANVKLIKKPDDSEKAAYTAVGWGTTSADDVYAYPSQIQQVRLAVGSKSTCTDIWAPYTNLTNSLCLVPAKSSSNVCDGDGLLVKVASDKTVGLAGILNMVAAKKDVPAEKCTDSGAVDFFTTLDNYVGWLTQVTPLKESSLVSTASFSYDSSSTDDVDEASSSASDSDGLDDVESSKSGVARRSISLGVSAAAFALAAAGSMF
ncbi:hypothetical protein LPJ61_003800 [Coemansia biformis]|uniref:Peptidase S1 domain-containing protein n=1 Tax=Coemansia biformis TaxID=1286918 RepID=A0A9W7Y5Y9_9FUNG|nr:hypothetical protein LPJ61_003800 [Coemansia biformis]